MANEPTPTTPEAIALAAAALRGETPVAKANPFADDDKDKDAKEVAKAEDPKDEETVAKAEEQGDKEDVAKALGVVLPGLIAEAVSAALAPFAGELAEVRKSLGVVTQSTQATLEFQNATTGILTTLRAEAEEQREVTKSVAATVEAVAAQPAGRKAALSAEDVVAVAKALPTAGVIDLQPLRDWGREQGLDTATRTTFVRHAQMGNYAGIPQDVRKAMGVTE